MFVGPTGEHGGQGRGLQSSLDMAVVSLDMGVDWDWVVPDWAGFQHPMELMRTRMDIG